MAKTVKAQTTATKASEGPVVGGILGGFAGVIFLVYLGRKAKEEWDKRRLLRTVEGLKLYLNKLAGNTTRHPVVFISYNWSDTSSAIVDRLEQALI